ncbi:MAG TPA: phage holin family protein [Candidatus Binatia bacterium]|jgi:uncharacterized membrane protein YqjE|nr:phage holin family protein [Candidatus Binatia bacterium]
MRPTEPAGILESLRRAGAGVLALAQNRLELFSVELQEQKARLLKVLVLLAVTVFLGSMALVLVTATIVVLVGENARGPVLVGLSVLYALGAVVAFLALRKELRSAPAPLEDTLSEIKKDCDWLNSRK